MRARQYISEAALPPDVRAVLFDAFDDAWAQLGPNVSGGHTVVDAARVCLAEIVLALAEVGPIDRDKIKSAAVEIFRQTHLIENQSN